LQASRFVLYEEEDRDPRQQLVLPRAGARDRAQPAGQRDCGSTSSLPVGLRMGEGAPQSGRPLDQRALLYHAAGQRAPQPAAMTSCSASPGARPRVLARRGFARVCALDDNLLKAVITPRAAGMDTSRRPVNVVVITDVVITDEPAILDQLLGRDRPLGCSQRAEKAPPATPAAYV
jgi:hypothetical protein